MSIKSDRITAFVESLIYFLALVGSVGIEVSLDVGWVKWRFLNACMGPVYFKLVQIQT